MHSGASTSYISHPYLRIPNGRAGICMQMPRIQIAQLGLARTARLLAWKGSGFGPFTVRNHVNSADGGAGSIFVFLVG